MPFPPPTRGPSQLDPIAEAKATNALTMKAVVIREPARIYGPECPRQMGTAVRFHPLTFSITLYSNVCGNLAGLSHALLC